jgi:hypothetical protein
MTIARIGAMRVVATYKSLVVDAYNARFAT